MKVSGWGSHPNANRIGKNKMNTVQVSECVYVRVRGEVSEWYVDTLTPYTILLQLQHTQISNGQDNNWDFTQVEASLPYSRCIGFIYYKY